MDKNVVERMIVPYNPPSVNMTHQNQFNLFVPVGGINKVGVVGYSTDFVIDEPNILSLRDRTKTLLDSNAFVLTLDTINYNNNVDVLSTWRSNIVLKKRESGNILIEFVVYGKGEKFITGPLSVLTYLQNNACYSSKIVVADQSFLRVEAGDAMYFLEGFSHREINDHTYFSTTTMAFTYSDVIVEYNTEDVLAGSLEKTANILDEKIDDNTNTLNKKIDDNLNSIESKAISTVTYNSDTGELVLTTIDEKKTHKFDLIQMSLLSNVELVAENDLIFTFRLQDDSTKTVTFSLDTILSTLWTQEIEGASGVALTVPPTTQAVIEHVREKTDERVEKILPRVSDNDNNFVYGTDEFGTTKLIESASLSLPNTVVERDGSAHFDIAEPVNDTHPVSKSYFNTKINHPLYEDVNELDRRLDVVESMVYEDKYELKVFDDKAISVEFDNVLDFALLSRVNCMAGQFASGEEFERKLSDHTYLSETTVDLDTFNLDTVITCIPLFPELSNFSSYEFTEVIGDPDDPVYITFTNSHYSTTSLRGMSVRIYHKQNDEEVPYDATLDDVEEYLTFSNMYYTGVPCNLMLNNYVALQNAKLRSIRVGYPYDVTNVELYTGASRPNDGDHAIMMFAGDKYYVSMPFKVLPEVEITVSAKSESEIDGEFIDYPAPFFSKERIRKMAFDVPSTMTTYVNRLGFYKNTPLDTALTKDLRISDIQVKFSDINHAQVVRETQRIDIPDEIYVRAGYQNPNSFIDFENRIFFDANTGDFIDVSDVIPENAGLFVLKPGMIVTGFDTLGRPLWMHPVIHYAVERKS